MVKRSALRVFPERDSLSPIFDDLYRWNILFVAILHVPPIWRPVVEQRAYAVRFGRGADVGGPLTEDAVVRRRRARSAAGCSYSALRAFAGRERRFFRAISARPARSVHTGATPGSRGACYVLSTSLPKLLPENSLSKVSGNVSKPSTISSLCLSLPSLIQPAMAFTPSA